MSISDIFQSEEERRYSSHYNGLAVGVVTSIDDPDNQSRVKVKILARDTSEFETDFIRVMTPMTGEEWGMFFFPEVGDEVLLGFGGGDITRPYVLGGLWNKKYRAPAKISNQKNDIRKIRTKSGHELIFGDEQDKEFIKIATPNQLMVNLDDSNKVISIKDKDGKNIVKIDSKNGIVNVTAEKKVVVASGNSKMTLDGNGNKVSLESAQSINIKSQQIVIESKGTLDIKSSGTLNVKADGPANLKGAIVKIN